MSFQASTTSWFHYADTKTKLLLQSASLTKYNKLFLSLNVFWILNMHQKYSLELFTGNKKCIQLTMSMPPWTLLFNMLTTCLRNIRQSNNTLKIQMKEALTLVLINLESLECIEKVKVKIFQISTVYQITDYFSTAVSYSIS